MFTVVGLACDLVGAAVLAIGLFRHSKALYSGSSRSPEEAAEDQAYGITGFVLLAAGFGLQALPSFGANWSGSPCDAAIAGAVTLAVALVVAWLMYGATFLLRFRSERRYFNKYEGTWPEYRRRRKSYRFWRLEWQQKDGTWSRPRD